MSCLVDVVGLFVVRIVSFGLFVCAQEFVKWMPAHVGFLFSVSLALSVWTNTGIGKSCVCVLAHVESPGIVNSQLSTLKQAVCLL